MKREHSLATNVSASIDGWLRNDTREFAMSMIAARRFALADPRVIRAREQANLVHAAVATEFAGLYVADPGMSLVARTRQRLAQSLARVLARAAARLAAVE